MNPLPIVYEDNHLLVVVKPVFMPSQSDRSGTLDALTAMKMAIKVRDQKPGRVYLALCHRLDQPVSGLLVMAKTSKAAGRMATLWRTRQVTKHYLAVLHGRLRDGHDVWCDSLSTTKKGGRYRVVAPDDGVPARLTIAPYAYDVTRDTTLAIIALETGRSHQIRVQAASRNHPLVGDRRYGRETDLDRATPAVALFACHVAFTHPVTQKPLSFLIWPEDKVFDQSLSGLNRASLREAMMALEAHAVDGEDEW